MQETKESTDGVLLDYAPSTIPAPLQVAPADGKITITIPIPVSTVYCNQIALGIPYGTDASSLTVEALTTANLAVSPAAKWQVGSADGENFNFTDIDKAFVLSTISTDNNKIDYQIVVTIHGFTANSEIGSFAIQIQETSGTDGKTYTKKNTSIKLSKMPYLEFYVENFIATNGDGSGSLVAEVEYNTPVILTWVGSKNQYKIIYDENAPVDVGSDTNWTSPNLKQNTSFVLHATQQVDFYENGDPVEDSQKLHIYNTLTVKVKTPDVTANSIEAKHDISAEGALNIENGASIKNGATVRGTTIMIPGENSGQLHVTSSPNVADSIYIEGFSNDDESNASKLVISGRYVEPLPELKIYSKDTSISGKTSLKDASTDTLGVNGQTTLKRLEVSGETKMFKQAIELKEGSYSAYTDGFIIGQVTYPDDVMAYSWKMISGGTSGGLIARAIGGNYVMYLNDDMDSFWMYHHPSNFMLPVSAGQRFSFGFVTAILPLFIPPHKFSWIPIGSEGDSTYSAISSDDGVLEELNKDMNNTLDKINQSKTKLSGEGKLSGGLVNVTFDESLAKKTAKRQYLVFLTPQEECNGLIAIDKSKQGFYVKELLEGKSNALFAWQIILQ